MKAVLPEFFCILQFQQRSTATRVRNVQRPIWLMGLNTEEDWGSSLIQEQRRPTCVEKWIIVDASRKILRTRARRVTRTSAVTENMDRRQGAGLHLHDVAVAKGLGEPQGMLQMADKSLSACKRDLFSFSQVAFTAESLQEIAIKSYGHWKS